MSFVLHHNDFCFTVFISCWLCIVILFSYWFYFLLVGYALPLLHVLMCFYCSLCHCFSHVVALFFLRLHYLIALVMLLHYFFHVVALSFFALLFFSPLLRCSLCTTSLLLLHCLAPPLMLFCSSCVAMVLFSCGLPTLLLMLCCSSCIALFILFALCLLFFLCCHVTSLLFSHYHSFGVGAQPLSTYWANTWCCFSHIIVTNFLVLLLFLFPWLVWYIHSPSYHM